MKNFDITEFIKLVLYHLFYISFGWFLTCGITYLFYVGIFSWWFPIRFPVEMITIIWVVIYNLRNVMKKH